MFENGFPKEMQDIVDLATHAISATTYNNIAVPVTKEQIYCYLGTEQIRFPYRIYYIDNLDKKIQSLSLMQQTILRCIFSRSCDGFVREKHIRELLLTDYPDWVIPYIVKVCDEYVIQMLDIVYKSIRNTNSSRIRSFCENNSVLLTKSYSRMISYWNVYYRNQYPDLKEYIGYKLFSECFGYTHFPESI